MRHRRIAATAIALTLVAGLAACGSDESSSDTTTAAGESPAVQLNDADIEFAQGMIAHHEQAIEMSEMALDPNTGASAEVVDLATRIKAAQDPEIEQMTAWLNAAGQSITMDTSDGHDMSSMEGMMSVEEMDELASLTGTEFDQRWLAMMIEHHEGAVSQAETVKANGSNPDVLALADEIIAAQQAEIQEMQALLEG